MCALPAESTKLASSKTKLPKLAHKRLQRFVVLFAKFLVNDTPDTIHDLRVASRRLQQTLRVFLPKKSPTNRKVFRVLRKTRRSLGTCRNLDVSIALIDKRRDSATAAALRRSWEAVRQSLRQQRERRIAHAQKELKRCDLIDFVSRTQERIAAISEEPDRVAQLWQRAGEALAAWKDALIAAKADPRIENIHGFRIAGKRLRYRVESLVELGDAAVKPLLQGLKMLQNDLGDWHDHKVLQQFTVEFIAQPGFLAQKPGMCRGLLLDMEREKQRDQALIDEALAKAEKLADEWRELKVSDEAKPGGTTDQ